MPKYTVHLRRPRPDYTSVEVEADDEGSAIEAAMEKARHKLIDWEESDFPGEPEFSEIEDGWGSDI